MGCIHHRSKHPGRRRDHALHMRPAALIAVVERRTSHPSGLIELAAMTVGRRFLPGLRSGRLFKGEPLSGLQYGEGQCASGCLQPFERMVDFVVARRVGLTVMNGDEATGPEALRCNDRLFGGEDGGNSVIHYAARVDPRAVDRKERRIEGPEGTTIIGPTAVPLRVAPVEYARAAAVNDPGTLGRAKSVHCRNGERHNARTPSREEYRLPHGDTLDQKSARIYPGNGICLRDQPTGFPKNGAKRGIAEMIAVPVSD